MTRWLRNNRVLAVRIGIYTSAIVVLSIVAERAPWDLLRDQFVTRERSDDTLVVAGVDLCPRLAEAMLEHHRRDLPERTIARVGGGQDDALEALLNRECDAAFLLGTPEASVQRLALSALGDTLQVLTIARGALEILAASPATDSLDLGALRSIVRGDSPRRLYAPDPAFGLWDPLREQLGLAGDVHAGVIFLEDVDAVLDAVRRDPTSLGLHWSFGAATDLRRVAIAPEGGPAIRPALTSIADGTYPLPVALHVALPRPAPVEGTAFANHLHGGRGQRQIARTGTVPDRLVLREILLSPSDDGGIQ